MCIYLNVLWRLFRAERLLDSKYSKKTDGRPGKDICSCTHSPFLPTAYSALALPLLTAIRYGRVFFRLRSGMRYDVVLNVYQYSLRLSLGLGFICNQWRSNRGGGDEEDISPSP